MKLICLQENLNKSLFATSHIANGNTTLPILNNILLKAEKGSLSLITTNLEMGIKSTARGKIEQEGTITVPAQLLANYVGLLHNKPIDLEAKDNILYLKSEKNKTKINGISAEEFPLFPNIEKEVKYTCKSGLLKKGIQQVISTVVPNDSRPEISGVLFSFDHNGLTLAGTDSYRLAEKKIPINISGSSAAGKKETVSAQQKVIVPVKTLQELLRIMPQPEETMEIYTSENQILFSWEETELISRIISGQYPDYGQIIPQNYKTKALVNLGDFTKVIKAASLFSQAGLNNVSLEFNPSKNKITVKSASSQIGENTAEIDADIKGIKNEIIFNYRYLLDGLSNIGTEEAALEIIDSNTPGVLRPTENKDYVYIVMPVRQ